MKGLLVAALMAIFLTGMTACAEDCAACKPGKVCATHQGEDDAAIKAAATMLKDKDFEERRAGVDRLVAAAGKHSNARSPKLIAEMVRVMADPASVRGYAAEKLGAVADEPAMLQVLTAEAAKQEKALSTNKPSKDADLPKWEESLKTLGSIYKGIGKLTTQPGAVVALDKAIRHQNPWVNSLAAEQCAVFKSNKVILKALVDMLAKFFAQNTNEGGNAAWAAISKALPVVSGHKDIPNQKDSADASRWNAEWQKWWRANEKAMK